MSFVRVAVETSTWQVRWANPKDKWDRGDTAGRVDNVFAELVEADTADNWYGESMTKELGFLKPGDSVYAVVVDYESGNTFGRSGGYAQIMDVFESVHDAEALYRLCTSYNENREPKARVSLGIEYLGKRYYVAWDGYFESVNDIAVWHLVIRGGGGGSEVVGMRSGR